MKMHREDIQPEKTERADINIVFGGFDKKLNKEAAQCNERILPLANHVILGNYLILPISQFLHF